MGILNHFSAIIQDSQSHHFWVEALTAVDLTGPTVDWPTVLTVDWPTVLTVDWPTVLTVADRPCWLLLTDRADCCWLTVADRPCWLTVADWPRWLLLTDCCWPTALTVADWLLLTDRADCCWLTVADRPRRLLLTDRAVADWLLLTDRADCCWLNVADWPPWLLPIDCCWLCWLTVADCADCCWLTVAGRLLLSDRVDCCYLRWLLLTDCCWQIVAIWPRGLLLPALTVADWLLLTDRADCCWLLLIDCCRLILHEVLSGTKIPGAKRLPYHQNDSAFRWAATRAIFKFHSLSGVIAQSQDSVHKPQPFWRQTRAKPKQGIEPMSSAYQPDVLPLGQTGSRITAFKGSLFSSWSGSEYHIFVGYAYLESWCLACCQAFCLVNFCPSSSFNYIFSPVLFLPA